ncbi:MAG: O-acetylhomoserine aminocarboxypropyltransferase/cysteine synthase family protein [Pseudomonadota bacterium]
MDKANAFNIETLSVQGGTTPDESTGARSTPIHQSCSFVFKDTQQASNRFHLKEEGFIYSRINNPTIAALEGRIAALEGGAGATCTSSGLSASLLAFSAILDSGDDFVSSCKIYGGTTSQFRDTFKRSFGWQCHFVNPLEPENFKKALTEKTKLIFVESISNPEGAIIDVEAVARIAEDAGIPLIVDNTVATPYIFQPFDYGAAAVTHSTTKYLSGHGQAMGGAVVDGGTFDWMKYSDKFTALAQEDPSYGLTFAESFPDNPLAIHNHAVGLRDLGMNQQAANAYYTLVGIETLHLRMQRHSENALKVAEFLNQHPAVSWVNYAGLADSPYKALADKYMRNGYCSALFTFGLAGGFDAAVKVVEGVELLSHVANIGDTKSLIIHPASTTHSELHDDQKIAAGALPEAIRLSIGIENVDDIIADLDQALSKVS